MSNENVSKSKVDTISNQSVSGVLEASLKDTKHISRKIVGQVGESSAVFYLKNKGYKIVGRNIRLKRGEIDVLALKDGVVRLVEVKTRLDRVSHKRPKFLKGSADIGDIRPSKVMSTKRKSSKLEKDKEGNAIEQIMPESNFSIRKISKLRSIADELVSIYPYPFDKLLDFDVKNGAEAMILRDSDDISVAIEGVAVVIEVLRNNVQNVRVRHYENLA